MSDENALPDLLNKRIAQLEAENKRLREENLRLLDALGEYEQWLIAKVRARKKTDK